MTPIVRSSARGILILAIALSAAARLCAQVTETPHTVPPGRLRLEVDGVKLSLDRADAAGNKYTALGVASTLVTTGLTDSLDVQVGVQLFVRETFEFRGSRDTHSGIGDIYFRTKWTFWRSEGLGAAMAVIPYVKVPTGSGAIGSDAVEGGFIVPWSMSVGGGVTAGAMFQWDHVRNDANDGYDAQWHVTGFAQRNLASILSVYAEASFAASSTGFSDWEGLLGLGALLNVTAHVQLDYELLRGLNSRATDWTHVLRVNWDW